MSLRNAITKQKLRCHKTAQFHKLVLPLLPVVYLFQRDNELLHRIEIGISRCNANIGDPDVVGSGCQVFP